MDGPTEWDDDDTLFFWTHPDLLDLERDEGLMSPDIWRPTSPNPDRPRPQPAEAVKCGTCGTHSVGPTCPKCDQPGGRK